MTAQKITLANKYVRLNLAPFYSFCAVPSLHVHEVDLLSGFVIAVADNEVWLLYFAMDGVKYGLI